MYWSFRFVFLTNFFQRQIRAIETHTPVLVMLCTPPVLCSSIIVLNLLMLLLDVESCKSNGIAFEWCVNVAPFRAARQG